jgi:polyvinyl alcohol dehydrogenase (cytochrome)
VSDVERNTHEVGTQVTADDNYLSGWEVLALVNCPTPLGHDVDFGAPPVLVPFSKGADILVAGQKSGAVFGRTAGVVWKTQVSAGGPLGGVEWGDGARLYMANADAFVPSPPGRPGLAALDPANRRELWFTPSPPIACDWTGGAACLHGISAPPLVMPGLSWQAI